jgi:hypothetical protein
MIAGSMLLANAGEVTERPKVRHWKCRVGQKLTAGSNPALSVFFFAIAMSVTQMQQWQ